jgi:hypothetical protein
MPQSNPWLNEAQNSLSPIKYLLANLSIKVRTSQYHYFVNLFKPEPKTKILDVGVTSTESLKDSNLFEKIYPYPQQITAATIENPHHLKALYSQITVVKIKPGEPLPFKDKQFDIVTSWATLEHVGDYREQEYFINELLRVGRKIFLTTPDRGCFYEPHTQFFFLHWLPLSMFRKICQLTGKNFLASVKYLNPLYFRDIQNMKLSKSITIKSSPILKYFPAHLLLYYR